MDKWNLLRSALQGKRESQSVASIHRNDGIFSVVEKKFTPWEWTHSFTVHSDTTLEALQQECREYMIARDIVEFFLTLSASPSDSTLLKQLVENAEESGCCRIKESSSERADVYWHDTSLRPFMTNCKYYKWILSTGEVVHAREKVKDAGIGVTQLLSHKLYGVDNTGNVKVWAAESMLLHVLLTNYRLDFENRSVLELGGGLTAVCGLGLASAIPSCSVFATDGHPECVTNQQVCIHMNHQHAIRSNCSSRDVQQNLPQISSHRLRWSKDDEYQELEGILEHNTRLNSTKSGTNTQLETEETYGSDDGKFSRIIAADCLFFRDFHDDLVSLLSSALAPGGKIFMLQPPRGGTMEEFLVKARKVFSIEVITDYDTKVSELHERYVLESCGDKTKYDPDIHFPVLLILSHRRDVAISSIE